MYHLTGDTKYLAIFKKTHDFGEKYHTDWKYGEWHSGMNEKLEPIGWKGAIYGVPSTTDVR